MALVRYRGSRPLDLPEIDRRLTAMTDAYYSAVESGDLAGADTAYAELDALLELRYHCPQQRTP